MTDRQLRILMRFAMRLKGYGKVDYISELIDECFKEETSPDSALQRHNQ